MRRRVYVILFSFAFFFCILFDSCFCLNTTFSNRDILYVGGDGIGNFSSIQDAINDSDNYDIVYVYNGTYNEKLFINKSINLIGENKSSTIIDGSNNFYCVSIRSDNVTISNLNLKKASIGVYLNFTRNITIKNIIFYNNSNGILLNEGCKVINFYSNYFENNTEGIRIYNSSDNTFNNNTFLNAENFDISIYGNSEDNFVTNNHFEKSHVAIKTNKFSDNNSIFNNNISNCRYGIYVSFSSNISVENNRIFNITSTGIYLKDSSFIDIFNNTISNSGNGIYIDNVDYYNITDDNFFINNNLNVKIKRKPPSVRIPTLESTLLVIILLVSMLIFYLKIRKDRD